MNRKEKAIIVCKFLKEKYKEHIAKIEGWHDTKFKLLIATILSQRTRDENTEKAARRLFDIADTPEKILKLSLKKLETLVRDVGFYRQKACKIKKICKVLLTKYKGNVPDKREMLLELPGVGYKTADVVLCYGFSVPVIPVDIHVAVCSKRIGLTNNSDPEKIKKDLEVIVPRKYRRIVNIGLINFGKEICMTRKPRCKTCQLSYVCNYYIKKIKNS